MNITKETLLHLIEDPATPAEQRGAFLQEAEAAEGAKEVEALYHKVCAARGGTKAFQTKAPTYKKK